MPAEAFAEAKSWRWKAIALAVSGPLLGGLFWVGCPLWLLVPLHMLSGYGAWRLWRRPGPGGRELGLQACSLTLCVPVVGSACAWLVFGRVGRRETSVLDAYRRYIAFAHRESPVLRPIDPRARLLREVGVMPLRDQLTQGELAAKQSAATALAELEGDGGVRVLRQALTHSADDTRLLASLALLRKEETLVSALNLAREATKAKDAPARAWLGLARVARRYAESGLPAPRAAESFWQECETAARRALMGPEALEGWLHMAASYAGRRQSSAALEAAEAALALDPECTEAAVCRCEALFALGRLDALRDATRPLARAGGLQEVASYWEAAHVG
ncbi:MAG TPA: hypothetical protein V6D47_22425 [Oscillatoriaceae cyanobacterium]